MNENSKRRRLASVRDACEYIGCGTTVCYELINSGKIIGLKMGGKTLVDLDSIDEFHRKLPRVGAQA
jgi:excisionase family DNA binding protein